VALGVIACPALCQVTLTPRGTAPLSSTTTDQLGAAFTVTGLSGVAYAGPRDDGSHRFYAVMDNSDKVIELGVRFGPDGSIVAADVVGGFRLDESRDFEGIAIAATIGHVLLSDEGTPAIREYDLASGALVHAWSTPTVFGSRRANFGFESLARDAGVAWTCNEEALEVDGPLSTTAAGTVVRLLRYDDGLPSAQFAYRTEPIHGFAVPGSRSGVSDLVLLPGGTLLALERSLALASPLFLTRIYEVGLAGVTDVSGLGSLVGASYVSASKRLVHAGGHTNLEGLCLGPRLAGGGWAMLGVVDDADALSVNEVVAFEARGLRACPADWDASGSIDSGDFFAFLNEFFGGAADFNADGLTDSRDFFAFLSAWFAGC
jgi:hypothetical protein